MASSYSLYSNTVESFIKNKRIKEVVAKPTKIEVLNEFSLSGLREMSGEEYGYCEYWCYGVESVKGQPFWKAWYKRQWNFIYSFTFFRVKMRFFPANMDYQKKYFPSSLPSSKLTISLISIYKHYAIDIADPSSMQDACHINFVIDLAHLGVSVAQW